MGQFSKVNFWKLLGNFYPYCSAINIIKRLKEELQRQSFLPRDASAERGDATVSRLSVRPSVCNVQVP